MTPPIPTPSDLADETLDLIPSPRYWMKGKLEGGAGEERRCLIGGFTEVLRRRGYFMDIGLFGADGSSDGEGYKILYDTCKKAAQIITEQYPSRVTIVDGLPSYAVGQFNDHWETRYTDVRLVLEKLRAG